MAKRRRGEGAEGGQAAGEGAVLVQLSGDFHGKAGLPGCTACMAAWQALCTVSDMEYDLAPPLPENFHASSG